MGVYSHDPHSQRARQNTAADLIVVRLVRAAMAPDWHPASVLATLDQADVDYVQLRAARARLLRALENQKSRAGQRALNVLEIAMSRRIQP